MTTTTVSPVQSPRADYASVIWIEIDHGDIHGSEPERYQAEIACQDSVWRLRSFALPDGETLFELADQKEGADPLTALRAMMGGNTA